MLKWQKENTLVKRKSNKKDCRMGRKGKEQPGQNHRKSPKAAKSTNLAAGEVGAQSVITS